MYLEPVLLEKKMSSTPLELGRADTSPDYLERARGIAPMLAATADEIEERRELP